MFPESTVISLWVEIIHYILLASSIIVCTYRVSDKHLYILDTLVLISESVCSSLIHWNIMFSICVNCPLKPSVTWLAVFLLKTGHRCLNVRSHRRLSIFLVFRSQGSTLCCSPIRSSALSGKMPASSYAFLNSALLISLLVVRCLCFRPLPWIAMACHGHTILYFSSLCRVFILNPLS